MQRSHLRPHRGNGAVVEVVVAQHKEDGHLPSTAKGLQHPGDAVGFRHVAAEQHGTRLGSRYLGHEGCELLASKKVEVGISQPCQTHPAIIRSDG